MFHAYSIETLYHFICHKCKKWWSISGWEETDKITCPTCGTTSSVIPDRRGASRG